MYPADGTPQTLVIRLRLMTGNKSLFARHQCFPSVLFVHDIYLLRISSACVHVNTGDDSETAVTRNAKGIFLSPNKASVSTLQSSRHVVVSYVIPRSPA
jgi:hypothetical protein